MPSHQTNIHCLRQQLATFGSAHLSVYDYSHYIVKESISCKCIVIFRMLYCMVLIPAAVPAALLNNSKRAWLTIYLNYVQMSHLFYFSANPTNYHLSSSTWAGDLLLVNFFLNHWCGIPEIQWTNQSVDTIQLIFVQCLFYTPFNNSSFKSLNYVISGHFQRNVNIIHHPAARSEFFSKKLHISSRLKTWSLVCLV